MQCRLGRKYTRKYKRILRKEYQKLFDILEPSVVSLCMSCFHQLHDNTTLQTVSISIPFPSSFLLDTIGYLLRRCLHASKLSRNWRQSIRQSVRRWIEGTIHSRQSEIGGGVYSQQDDGLTSYNNRRKFSS